jgi:hypothetical protein
MQNFVCKTLIDSTAFRETRHKKMDASASQQLAFLMLILHEEIFGVLQSHLGGQGKAWPKEKSEWKKNWNTWKAAKKSRGL